MSNGAEAEPEEEARNWEKVLRRDEKGVVDEETRQKVQQEEELLIVDGAELLVTVEEIPVPNAILALATEPIVLTDATPSDEEHACSDGGNVAEQDVAEDVVPPALTEVRQDVLDGELDDLVKELPEVENPDITDHKRCEEPVDKMNDVVVVKV